MPYTVKQVSTLTGISPDRLRAWERRYDVVRPARSESRYRLYDDEDVARLRMMARLVASGAPASLAADEVRTAFANAVQPQGPETSASAATSTFPPVDALVEPAASLDRATIDHVLDRAFAAGSFESVTEHWLLPALAALGDAWSEGRIDVAGEHFASSAARRRLSRAFDAAGTALGGPVVLVGLPPGSQHELGALAFATCLRRLGADLRWLGADVPLDSWVRAARTLAPAAVVLTVATAQDANPAAAVNRALQADQPHLRVFVGGRGVTTGAGDAAVTGATRLPHPVVAAAQLVAEQLRHAR